MLRALDTVEDDMEAYQGRFRTRFTKVHHTFKHTFGIVWPRFDLVGRLLLPLLKLKMKAAHGTGREAEKQAELISFGEKRLLGFRPRVA